MVRRPRRERCYWNPGRQGGFPSSALCPSYDPVGPIIRDARVCTDGIDSSAHTYPHTGWPRATGAGLFWSAATQVGARCRCEAMHLSGRFAPLDALRRLFIERCASAAGRRMAECARTTTVHRSLGANQVDALADANRIGGFDGLVVDADMTALDRLDGQAARLEKRPPTAICRGAGRRGRMFRRGHGIEGRFRKLRRPGARRFPFS